MSSGTRIFVTGIGICSALGLGSEENLRALKEGRSGIAFPRLLKTALTNLPAGEVKFTNDQLRQLLGIDAGCNLPRTSLLGALALREAISDAGLSAEILADSALISGTTVGGMDRTEATFPRFEVPHDCGATTEDMADLAGGFKIATTLSTACSSAANAMITGAALIRSGRCRAVAAGGSECLSDYHLHGFNSLMILSDEPCRPFDAHGEGAAFLILESEESVRERGGRAIAELCGWGNACDAYHQTASSPEGQGAFLAMKSALEMAAVPPSAVSYINAHGTSTPNNDASESAAIRRLFGENYPPVSSTKPFTGHTTSASGSIEAVYCLLAMQHSFIPTNLNWEEADSACITPFTGKSSEEHSLEYALCNAFGFGGNDTSLIFKKI